MLALAAGATAAIVISFIYTPLGLPETRSCWFRSVSGLPCPGCGLTRAFCAISHGEFAEAWKHNPFGFGFYLFALVLIAWPLVHYRRPDLIDRIWRSKAVSWVPVTWVALMWVYGIWRILNAD